MEQIRDEVLRFSLQTIQLKSQYLFGFLKIKALGMQREVGENQELTLYIPILSHTLEGAWVMTMRG